MKIRKKVLVAVAVLEVAFPVLAVPVSDDLDIGGAVRLNYGWKDYDNDAKLEFELFRADINYDDGQLFASAQYRWYQVQNVIHHAWMGYKFSDNASVKVGVTQVPFGLLPYASHSFWFGSTYYLGLEDDYDAGVHWQYEQDGWRYDVAYFANDEYGDGSRFKRYSFDTATTAARPYEEAGQLNGRIEHSFSSGDIHHTLGASLQLNRFDYQPVAGGATGSDTDGYAAAIHWQLDWHSWQTQLQYIHYDYNMPDERMAMSAFAYPFEIAAKADVVTTNLSRSIEVSWGAISNITCYNDFTHTVVSGTGLKNSLQNVTGCAVTAGKFYTYVDWIAGKNMWFDGGSGIGIDEGVDGWHSRLNINIGWYF
ncbi:hypothetical protein KDN34_04325 [Shewanella yunxiaonensis]|uniref:Phosphate-selective porin O and P n=2 Tax=Shewanella yunxiaonensis TaxID=2829809 RepID=A0ABX7YZQ3_9GAMM|nr:hypothetical protein KDN34_04325 [Shewanella yunxiaonensis]